MTHGLITQKMIDNLIATARKNKAAYPLQVRLKVGAGIFNGFLYENGQLVEGETIEGSSPVVPATETGNDTSASGV